MRMRDTYSIFVSVTAGQLTKGAISVVDGLPPGCRFRSARAEWDGASQWAVLTFEPIATDYRPEDLVRYIGLNPQIHAEPAVPAPTPLPESALFDAQARAFTAFRLARNRGEDEASALVSALNVYQALAGRS